MIGSSRYGDHQYGSMRDMSYLTYPLSKNYTYSDITDRVWMQTGMDNWRAGLTRVLAEIKMAVGEIAIESIKAGDAYYLRRRHRWYPDNSSPDPHLNFWDFNPFPWKFVSVVQRVSGGLRVPVIIVDDPEFEAKKSLSSLYSSSVVGMVESDYIELHGNLDRTTDFFEAVYLRQPDIVTVTNANYSRTYVDLPDSQIGRLTQRVVQRILEN